MNQQSRESIKQFLLLMGLNSSLIEENFNNNLKFLKLNDSNCQNYKTLTVLTDVLKFLTQKKFFVEKNIKKLLIFRKKIHLNNKEMSILVFLISAYEIIKKKSFLKFVNFYCRN